MKIHSNSDFIPAAQQADNTSDRREFLKMAGTSVAAGGVLSTTGGERGSARATTHPTLSGNVKFMNFYPFNDIGTISPRPMLFITGDQAHSKEFSEDAYKRAAQPKELFIFAGAGHVDLYDRVNLIPWSKLSSFFGKHLVQASV